MWTKSKHGCKAHFDASANSWEEKAFAEDAARPFGAFVWPPRSYTCNFCGREFRSAQALGGHMNIHRRDRARLRHNEIAHHHHKSQQNHTQNPFKSMGVEVPGQTCTYVYNPNPNSSPRVVASSLSLSRVSSPSTQENCNEQFMISYAAQEHDKGSTFSSPPSWSDSVSNRVFSISDSKIAGKENSKKQNPRVLVHDEDDSVKHNLFVNLNLVVGHTKEETLGCKRRKADELSLPLFLKSSSTSINRLHLQSPIIEHNLGRVEDLDLELRLGARPKVK